MNIIEYDSNLLIGFYKKNNIDFDINKGYFGVNVKSYALFINNIMVGAISFSKYNNLDYIEAIAVDNLYRKKGYGKILMNKAISEMNGPIYAIFKVDNFYLGYGFQDTSIDLVGNNCKSCINYKVNCFPKTMVYIKEKGE